MSALATARSEKLVGRIPVANIWLLFLYASELANWRGRFEANLEDDDTNFPTLVARLLAHAVERRLQRNLSRGYVKQAGLLSRVRGRIDLLETLAHDHLAQGRVACRFEELTLDTARNRLVLSALVRIAPHVDAVDVAHRCRVLAGDLGRLGVVSSMPSRSDLTADVIGRNEIEDRLMVALAKLALDLALPTEDVGSHTMTEAVRDAVATRKLFERAVGGFYTAELNGRDGWRVTRGRTLEWPVESASQGAMSILPGMVTDIVLTNAALKRRIVIDTKFASILSPGRWEKPTLRSGYLYQMYAYLRSQEGRGDSISDNAEGLLLHPAIDEDIDEIIVVQGHRIRFATVDLAGSSDSIRSRLKSLAGQSSIVQGDGGR